MVGPAHPLRARVPKLRKAAFAVFRLDRFGESVHPKTPASPNHMASSQSDNRAAVSRPGIGWAGGLKSARELYKAGAYTRPLLSST